MTKKELLNSDIFKSLHDDAEIVFNTCKDFKFKESLVPQHIHAIYKLVNEKEVLHDIYTLDELIKPKFRIKPEYKEFLVIEALPLEFMKRKLNFTFDL